MGYAYYSAHGKTYSGNTLEEVSDFPMFPYNFVSAEEQSLYRTTVPFSITIITLDPQAEIPYHLTVVSPDFYMYVELDQNEYKQQVIGRGQHMHNTYEIVYTREGEFYQQIEARRYKYAARSCCLLNRDIRHKEEYTSAFSTVTLSLSPEFLKDLFADPYDRVFSAKALSWQNNEELRHFFNTELNETDMRRKSYLNFSPIFDLTDSKDMIHEIFEQLTQCIIDPAPGNSFLFRALLCQLLDQLSDRDRYSTELVSLGTRTENRIFSEVTQLMEKSNGRISRAELVERLNYSGVYLNQIVNKFTGMSIFQYGSYFAMKRAAWLLTRGGMTATQVCTELGFTDRTHFYKLFREEFGVTPKQYQKQKR